MSSGVFHFNDMSYALKMRINVFVFFVFFILSQDIGTVYQIFADEVLGSGQFGVVYGGASYISLGMEWGGKRTKGT